MYWLLRISGHFRDTSVEAERIDAVRSCLDGNKRCSIGAGHGEEHRRASFFGEAQQNLGGKFAQRFTLFYYFGCRLVKKCNFSREIAALSMSNNC